MARRVAIVGAGRMGAQHAAMLHELVIGAEVAALVDPDTDRAAALASRIGGVPTVAHPGDVIGAKGIDAVLIASPDPTHADLAIACLEAGVPVLCEKPIATTVEDAARVVDAEVGTNRRLLQVGLMREFDPAHRAVADAIVRGDIGRPVFLRATHLNPAEHQPRTPAEIVVNSAIHDIHTARWLLVGEVAEVSAVAVPLDGPEGAAARLVHLVLRFDDGALAVIDVDADSRLGYHVAVELWGTAGQASTPAVPVAGDGSSVIEDLWMARFGEAYVAELTAWVASLGGGDPAGPSAWDGYAAQIVAAACVRAEQTGHREAVRLPPRPSLYGGG